jgi:sialidase-1
LPADRRWRRHSCAAGVALLLAHALVAADGVVEKVTAWEHDTGGYAQFRIPGVVVTRAGTVLAYAEARRTARSDWAEIDLVMRRSTDAGRTFGEAIRIGHMNESFAKNPVAVARNQGTGMGTTYSNPVAIADRNGEVHFLFCVEYQRAFYMRSQDDGRTFSAPVEITGAFEGFRAVYPWKVLATGPGHGIQLKNGRLLVPVWLSLGTQGNGHGPSVTATIYSDDHGKTWHAGVIAGPDTPEMPSPNETVAVQLADGRIMLNMRSPSARQRRIVAFSKDGATGWSAPVFDDALFEPVCSAGLLRAGKHTLIFVNPDSAKRERRNLTVRVSDDDGRTWTAKRTIEPGPSAYADLAMLPDGTVLCLYESGTASPYERLILARFPLAWIHAMPH